MVEVIEVKTWENITRGSYFTGHGYFMVRLKEENQIFEIAKNLNLPYIFKKFKELICIDGTYLYWYKP